MIDSLPTENVWTAAAATAVFLATLIAGWLARQRRKPTLETLIAQTPDPDIANAERDRGWWFGVSDNQITLVLIALTFMSGGMTFHGLFTDLERDGGATTHTGLQALSIGVSVTLAIYVGWLVIMKLGPRMRTALLGLTGYLFAILFTCWAVGVSSWYNLVGMAGPSAIIMYMDDETSRMGRIVDDVTERASQARAVIPSLDALAASSCAAYDAEVSKGLGTGSSGTGPYSQALLTACTAARTVATSLRTAADRAEANAQKLGETLRGISHSVIDRNVPVSVREDRFRAGVAEVEDLLRSVRNEGLAPAAEASLASLRTSVLELPTDNTAFGAKQTALLSAVKSQMSEAADALSVVLAGLKQGSGAAFEQPKRVSVTDVTLRYIDRFIPQLLIAVGLDVYALFMMTYLIMAASGKPKIRRRRGRFDDWLDLDPTIPEALLNAPANTKSKTKSKSTTKEEASP